MLEEEKEESKFSPIKKFDDEIEKSGSAVKS